MNKWLMYSVSPPCRQVMPDQAETSLWQSKGERDCHNPTGSHSGVARDGERLVASPLS